MRFGLVLSIIGYFLLLNYSCSTQNNIQFVEYNSITTGAEILINTGLPQLENKNIGIVANQASLVGQTHLVDTLISKGVNIMRIFSPEHGFRGKSEAGATVVDGTDMKTGIKIVSLYGKHKKPNKTDLANIDVMLFDLQDVGVRYYTYISTLTYVMEACAEYDVPLIILDRPNPNGFYMDGPVLDSNYRSFVGMHEVPVVYGMTIGEYGRMVNGETWLINDLKCNLSVIPLQGYSHNMIFELPVKPSPNLPNWQSVYLYPSICLFEGTIMSEGRGTDFPFQVYGHPDYPKGNFSFTPRSIPGTSNNPKFKGTVCYGQNLTEFADNFQTNTDHFSLHWLIESYNLLTETEAFFTPFFDILAGNDELRKQIEADLSETEIRNSWKQEHEEFEKTRLKYLLYN